MRTSEPNAEEERCADKEPDPLSIDAGLRPVWGCLSPIQAESLFLGVVLCAPLSLKLQGEVVPSGSLTLSPPVKAASTISELSPSGYRERVTRVNKGSSLASVAAYPRVPN